MTQITLNVVGIDIYGTVYKFKKMNFNFKRKSIEIQSNALEMNKRLAKKYNKKPEELDIADLTPQEQLELAEFTINSQAIVEGLLVDPADAHIIGELDEDGIQTIIKALQ